jgi:hypothetical protein
MLAITRFARIAEVITAAADRRLAAEPTARGVEVTLEGEDAAELERMFRADQERTETLLRYAVEDWVAGRSEPVDRVAVRFGPLTVSVR